MSTESNNNYSTEYLPKEGWWPTWAEHDFVGAFSALRNEFIFSAVEFLGEQMPRPFVGLNNLVNEGLKLPQSLWGSYFDGMLTPEIVIEAFRGADKVKKINFNDVEPYAEDFASCFNEFVSKVEFDQEINMNFICMMFSTFVRENGSLKNIKEYRATDPNSTVGKAQSRYYDSGYCGRGLVLLTFEGNYRAFDAWCKQNNYPYSPLANPDQLTEINECGWLSALWYLFVHANSGGKFQSVKYFCEADLENSVMVVGGFAPNSDIIKNSIEITGKVFEAMMAHFQEVKIDGQTLASNASSSSGKKRSRPALSSRSSSVLSSGEGYLAAGGSGSNGSKPKPKGKSKGKSKEQQRTENKENLKQRYTEANKKVQEQYVYPPGEGFKFSKTLAESVKNGGTIELYLYRYIDYGLLSEKDHKYIMGQLFINTIFFCDTFEETTSEFNMLEMPISNEALNGHIAEGRYRVLFTPDGPDINALSEAILGNKTQQGQQLTTNLTSKSNSTDSDYYNRITKNGTSKLPEIERTGKVFRAGSKDEIDTGAGLGGDICVGIKKEETKTVDFNNLGENDQVGAVTYKLTSTHMVLEALVAILNTMLQDTVIYITISHLKPQQSKLLSDLITVADLVPDYGNNQAGLNSTTAIRTWLYGGPPPTTETDSGAQQKLSAMMVNFKIPWPNGTPGGRPGSITVHNKLAPIVKAAMERICKETNFDAANYVGGFCFRGINTNKGHQAKLSNHAFGSAIDFSPSNNGYHAPDGKPDSNLHMRTGNHPVVKIMANMGFSWGGDYGGGWASSGAHDYMHFEYTGKIF